MIVFRLINETNSGKQIVDLLKFGDKMLRKKIHVGIFIFNEVEVLDFEGPFEVFSLAEEDDEKLFKVTIISENCEIIHARNGLKVQPDLSFNHELDLDILIIPGGYGAEEVEIKNKKVIEAAMKASEKAKRMEYDIQ